MRTVELRGHAIKQGALDQFVEERRRLLAGENA
jgi:hypothetical protein